MKSRNYVTTFFLRPLMYCLFISDELTNDMDSEIR